MTFVPFLLLQETFSVASRHPIISLDPACVLHFAAAAGSSVSQVKSGPEGWKPLDDIGPQGWEDEPTQVNEQKLQEFEL